VEQAKSRRGGNHLQRQQPQTAGGRRVSHQWVDCDRTFIAARYDRIAGMIGFIDWLFFVPRHFRAHAATRLALRPGQRVLEIGCGTGRNFPYLRAAVGAQGQIYGVDLSAGMLAKARALCRQQRWTNVELALEDAAEYIAPEPLDAVLFGLSYNTMPHHLLVLHQALKQLRPGGRIVIMDGRSPPGWAASSFCPSASG
jgi:demethylmenaquinone methyltransferase/2-methoxy-6-polyprenyl-1,4-benzoquinol methylase